MRLLYLPSTGRRTTGARQLLERTVQNTVDIGYGSTQYAVVNAFVAEIERTWALALRLDTRPWAADVRSAGALVPAEDERLADLPTDELLFGVPERWDLELVSTYTYTPGTFIGPEGQTYEAADIDRCILTADGLLLQKGTLLHRIDLYDKWGLPVDPSSEGVFGGSNERFALVSVDDSAYALFTGSVAAEVEVNVQMQGLALVYGGPGVYRTTIQTTGLAMIVDGDDVTALEGYLAPGYMYRADNTRVNFEIVDDLISILDGDDPGTEFRFYYTAEFTIDHTTAAAAVEQPVYAYQDMPSYSLTSIAENFYRMPSRNDIRTVQLLDTLCNVPGLVGAVSVDATGFVGRVNVGHTIRAVLPSEFHTVVADSHTVSVVEHDDEMLVLQQSFPDLDICGLSWTPEGHLAVISATENGFEVYAVKDVRNARTGSWRIPYEQ